ncbi:DUF2079 domain-containing protein [Ancylothrix sp. C2]|nr:DUF2079 domain-containing protein [Ancylothrix sp. D3o]
MKQYLSFKPFRGLWQNQLGLGKVLILAGVFFAVTFGLALHRYYSFYTSFDHGLFNQLFWNSTHGHLFQGSLSSNNSNASLVQGQLPSVSYVHLGQHFVLSLLLWMPLYALFPSPLTLIVLQVGLLTAAGVVLYFLARCYLPDRLSFWISASFYGANPVIGPAVDNFYEQCQIPLFVFGLLLAMEKEWWWVFWLLAGLLLMVREDAGITLFGIGFYLLLSRRYPVTGLFLCFVSFSYVVAVTNLLMPLFSDDNSRLYLGTYFKKFIKSEDPSTLELLWAIITQPHLMLQAIFVKFDQQVRYVLGLGLPLGFIPAVSPAAWLMSIFPLMVLVLQVGNKYALSINTRYTLTVVPGLFYGAILWWARQSEFKLPVKKFDRQFIRNCWNFWKTQRQKILTQKNPKSLTPRFRRLWVGCIILSMFFTVTSNPHRSLYFMVPFSIQPLVYMPLNQRWEHSAQLQKVMQLIPPDASVATTGDGVPHLSRRREIVRIPFLQVKNEEGMPVDIEYALVDFWQLKQPKLAAPLDRGRLGEMGPIVDRVLANKSYGIIKFTDDIVLLKKGTVSNPDALSGWLKLREELRSVFQRFA